MFHSATSPRIESIAVLPFVNATNDPKTEYLSDGITESLIDSLSQLPNFAVMSRNTVFRYKGQATDPQKVGHDLHVQAILTGRLIQTGDELMISVNLEDVRNGRQIWGEQYNRKLASLTSVEREIATDIYGRLRRRWWAGKTSCSPNVLPKARKLINSTYKAFSIGTRGPRRISRPQRTFSLRRSSKMGGTRWHMRGLPTPTV